MKAPQFTLSDQNGKSHSLSDYLGKYLVVYFYPKDDTPGCTTEACSFRDNSSEFQKMDIQIVGISKDTVTSHKKFFEKYNLNFPLLSDPTHKVIDVYGAWGEKKFMGKTFSGIQRNTYIVSPKGVIVKEYKNVNPLTHVGKILQDIEKIG